MKRHLRRIARVYGTFFEMAWSAARARAAGVFTSIILLAIAGAASGFTTKLVVDALSSGQARKAVAMGVLFLAVMAVSNILNGMFSLLLFDMGDRISQELDRRLMTIAAGVPGLDHLERPEFADKLKLIWERSYITVQIMWNAQSFAYIFVGLAASMVLLGSIHWVLAILPLGAIPGAVVQFRSNKKHYKQHDQTAPEERLAQHYVELATGVKAAKEIRLFGLADHLIGAHKKVTDAYVRKLFRDRLSRSGVGVVSGLLNGCALAASIAFLGYLTLRRGSGVSLGDFAMGIQITRMAIGHVEMASSSLSFLAEMSFVGERYLWLFDYKSDVKLIEPARAQQPPATIAEGITLQNLTFVYPGTEKTVLDDISLFIPAATTIAIVGENGAGKTSLIKLLCRFYDPTSGDILVDGVDLRTIDLDAWRQRSAVAFQDFMKYQFIAREAIGVGDLDHMADGAIVARATRQAGATAVINRLPDGIDTQLGRDFDAGIELSEGEWQRVALARGSMRTNPILLILDEPTASLDARAEHEVFERFAEMARPEAGPRPIAILVSHRFSTVRMADLIVVLNDGRIEELGSHDDLVAKGGHYAELFDLQASRYD